MIAQPEHPIVAAMNATLDRMLLDSGYVPDEPLPTLELTSVQKVAAYVPISAEMAMEYGLIPDTRPPVVITRRTRFRWWRQSKVAAVRIRLGEWLAGQRFRDSEDY